MSNFSFPLSKKGQKTLKHLCEFTVTCDGKWSHSNEWINSINASVQTLLTKKMSSARGAILVYLRVLKWRCVAPLHVCEHFFFTWTYIISFRACLPSKSKYSSAAHTHISVRITGRHLYKTKANTCQANAAALSSKRQNEKTVTCIRPTTLIIQLASNEDIFTQLVLTVT